MPPKIMHFEDYVRERLDRIEESNDQQLIKLDHMKGQMNIMQTDVTGLKQNDARRSRVEWIIAATFIIAGCGWIAKAVLFLGPKI